MLGSVKELSGYAIHAFDGEIGRVEECYFDDEKWTVRYLVVHTGGWLLGKKVLISPIAIQRVDWDTQIIDVALTRAQVENSPDIDTESPVSRQMEAKYFQHYKWPYYWTGAGIWGAAAIPGSIAETPFGSEEPSFSPATLEPDTDSSMQEQAIEGDPHLRSSEEVTGYRIETADAHFGHVSDLLFDELTWTIQYLAIHPKSWIPSKPVLVSTESVESVDWLQSKIRIKLKYAA
jgi:sporulation protein YlmC with PRC-barrel domain